jgi:hypothetical protein
MSTSYSTRVGIVVAIVEMMVEEAKIEVDMIVEAKTCEVIVTMTIVGTVVGTIIIVGMRKDVMEVIIIVTSVVVENVIVTMAERSKLKENCMEMSVWEMKDFGWII